MYYQYFGLTEAPFSIAVNPRYLFMSARHRDALAHLLYGVGTGGGFILLTGEVGTGKTTINRCLLQQLPPDTDIAIIFNPALNALELLAAVCDEFGIDYQREQPTLKSLTDSLHRFLLDNHQRGRKTVLLIDEAQHLDVTVLEQIRLLTNLETHSEKLLQIILIGQPELAQMLSRPELRQLNQRITARYDLQALNREETGAYIRHRLQVAGLSAGREIFPPAVVRGVYRASGGIPRVINVLCDRMLLGAYGRNSSRVDRAMLKLATDEVLGEQAAPVRSSDWWPLAAAGLALVAVLVVGGWYLLGPPPERPQARAADAAGESSAPLAPGPVRGKAAEAAQTAGAAGVAGAAGAPVEARGAAPADRADTLQQVAGTAMAGQSGAAQFPAAGSEWSAQLLPPGQAMRQLWGLYSRLRPPQTPCPADAWDGVRCTEAAAGTWNELARLDRPLWLSLVTPERFAAETLLLGIDGESAWILTRGGNPVVRVELAALAPLWSGDYRYLWRPPPGFTRALSRGSRGATVAEVARLFARLDEQPQPLTGTLFTAELEQRVRLFQRRHGLVDDGVVGERTLLQLNTLLGIDITAAQARARLQRGATDAEQTP